MISLIIGPLTERQIPQTTAAVWGTFNDKLGQDLIDVIIVEYAPLFENRRRLENAGNWEIDYDVVVMGSGIASMEVIISTPNIMSEVLSSVADTLTSWGTPVSVAEKIDAEASHTASSSMNLIIIPVAGTLVVVLLFCFIYLNFCRTKKTSSTEGQQSHIELAIGVFSEETDSESSLEEKSKGHSQPTQTTSFLFQRIQSRLDLLIPGKWTHADGKVQIKKNGEFSYTVEDGGQSFSAKLNQHGKFEVLFPGGSISAIIKGRETMVWEDGAKWHRVGTIQNSGESTSTKMTANVQWKEKSLSEQCLHTSGNKEQARVPRPVEIKQHEEDIILTIENDTSSSSSVLSVPKTPPADRELSSSVFKISGAADDTVTPASNLSDEKQESGMISGMSTETSEIGDSTGNVDIVLDRKSKSQAMLNKLWEDDPTETELV